MEHRKNDSGAERLSKDGVPQRISPLKVKLKLLETHTGSAAASEMTTRSLLASPIALSMQLIIQVFLMQALAFSLWKWLFPLIALLHLTAIFARPSFEFSALVSRWMQPITASTWMAWALSYSWLLPNLQVDPIVVALLGLSLSYSFTRGDIILGLLVYIIELVAIGYAFLPQDFAYEMWLLLAMIAGVINILSIRQWAIRDVQRSLDEEMSKGAREGGMLGEAFFDTYERNRINLRYVRWEGSSYDLQSNLSISGSSLEAISSTLGISLIERSEIEGILKSVIGRISRSVTLPFSRLPSEAILTTPQGTAVPVILAWRPCFHRLGWGVQVVLGMRLLIISGSESGRLRRKSAPRAILLEIESENSMEQTQLLDKIDAWAEIVKRCITYCSVPFDQVKVKRIFNSIHGMKAQIVRTALRSFESKVQELESLLQQTLQQANTSMGVIATDGIVERVRAELKATLSLCETYSRTLREDLGVKGSRDKGVYFSSVDGFLSIFEGSEEKLRDILEGRMGSSELRAALERVFPTVHQATQLLLKQSESVASEVRKELPILDYKGDDVRFKREVMEHLSEVILHLINNSLDHGIELPGERGSKGTRGTVTLRVEVKKRNVSLLWSDDGRGLHLGSLQLKFGGNGNQPVEEIVQNIFEAGVSTKSVGRISGRGVGLNAVRSIVEELGGIASIKVLNEGTSDSKHLSFAVEILLPLQAIV